jgi:hypothetical protein
VSRIDKVLNLSLFVPQQINLLQVIVSADGPGLTFEIAWLEVRQVARLVSGIRGDRLPRVGGHELGVSHLP